jgi:hypothetical protein
MKEQWLLQLYQVILVEILFQSLKQKIYPKDYFYWHHLILWRFDFFTRQPVGGTKF